MKVNTEFKDNSFDGELSENASLAPYTTWRIGGLAKRLYKPTSILDLSAFLKTLDEAEPIHFLGLGSNTLIRDGGFNGTVILTLGGLKKIEVLGDNLFKAEAGVSSAQFARFVARNNGAGVEFLAGVPGTIGGALFMNAGCFGGETWEYVEEVETLDRAGTLKTQQKDEFEISYRQVKGLDGAWFVSGTFKTVPGDKKESLNKIKTLLARRADTQPTGELNCGSVFRNPEGDYAARLIEATDLKGFKIGGASVSEKHANFIINTDNAKASDIESLIQTVQQKVFEKQGIKLYREVKIIGEK